MDYKVVRFSHINRFLLLLYLLLLGCPIYGQGIARNVEITAQYQVPKKKDAKGSGTYVPMPSALLCAFFEKKDAEAFLKYVKGHSYGGVIAFEEADLIQYKEDGHVVNGEKRTDDNGKAYMMELLAGSWIVCVPRGGEEPEMRQISGNNTCNFSIMKRVGDQNLEEVESSGKMTVKEWKKVKSPRVGNHITQPPTPYPIAANQAKDNGRYGMAINFLGLDGGDTLCHWRPFIKDGVDFHTTQHRRMGFEMIDSFNIVHDKLGRFVSRWPLRNHEADTVIFSWDLMLPQGKYYRALADVWAEDYNGYFFRDTVELFDGYSPEPLRFLEFAVKDIPIDVSRYKMEGKMDEHESNMSLHFGFLNGQAELDPNDSINNIEKEKLLAAFLPAYRDPDNTHFAVKLVGKASPEGSYATNSRLSTDRAKTIANWLSQQSGYYGANTESLVATWNEVADTLEALGELQKAEDIRVITRKYKTIEQQGSHVIALPYYKPYLYDKILPKFRVVNFSFNYVVKRPLEQDEVIGNYETDPNYRRTIKSGYEYMFLFEYLQKRPQELAEQARQAYEHIREFEYIHGSTTKPRPWPLAAYHYSRCLTQLHKPNTDILGPYFHKAYGPNRNFETREFQHQWWNDEAITIAEIAAYCGKGDYGAANFIAANYLPENDDRFKNLRLFLTCYDNHYKDPEVINAVAMTSSWNKAVIYAAQDEESDTINLRYLRMAFNILSDSALVNINDPRVLYLRGTVGFRIFNVKNTQKYYDGSYFTPNKEFDEEAWIKEFKKQNPEQGDHSIAFYLNLEKEDFFKKYPKGKSKWGNDILCACLQDSIQYLHILRFDGYFNKAFRKAFNYFWRGMREGQDIFTLQEKWDALMPEDKQ